jgi:cytochrome P450
VVHRNPDVFGADAEEYSPDRWLGKDEAKRPLMQQNLLSWGGGSRFCPGQYTEQVIIFKLYAILFTKFETRIEWDKSKSLAASAITFIPGLNCNLPSTVAQSLGRKDVEGITSPLGTVR